MCDKCCNEAKKDISIEICKSLKSVYNEIDTMKKNIDILQDKFSSFYDLTPEEYTEGFFKKLNLLDYNLFMINETIKSIEL